MKGKTWLKVLKIGLPVLLVAGLTVGLAVPTLAAPGRTANKTSPPANIVKSKVISKAADNSSFMIESANQTSIIRVDKNTKYFKLTRPLPRALTAITDELKNLERGLGLKKGILDREDILEDKNGTGNIVSLFRFGKKATFADIAVNDTVIVRLMPNENLAKEVLIIKAPRIQSVRGTINIVGSSLVITKSDGTNVPLTWDANTRFVLKGLIAVPNGYPATVIYNIDTLKAIAVFIAPPTTTSVPSI